MSNNRKILHRSTDCKYFELRAGMTTVKGEYAHVIGDIGGSIVEGGEHVFDNIAFGKFILELFKDGNEGYEKIVLLNYFLCYECAKYALGPFYIKRHYDGMYNLYEPQ